MVYLRLCLVGLGLLGASMSGCGGDRSERQPQAANSRHKPLPGWTIYNDSRRGYTIGFPSSWRRARHSISPRLRDPREILSLGTFTLRYRPTNCEAFAGSAQQDLGERDAFLTLLEVGRPTPAEEYPKGTILDIPPRPRSFITRAQQAPSHTDCPESDARVDWLPFEDAGRYFYALVAFGPSAPPALRLEAYRILDTLRLDSRVKPDWRAST